MLSLLLPGLGHVYMGRFGRGLIWLFGTLAIAVILGSDDVYRMEALALQAIAALFAAVDICLVIRSGGPVPRRR